MRTTIGPYRCLLAVSVLGGALGVRAMAQGAPDIVWMRAGTRVGCIPSPDLPDGQTLASGSDGNTIKLWRVSSGALLRTLMGHGSPVISVAFSPDGALFAYGRRHATVVVARNPFYMPACDPCDANCDGLVAQFDIEPFIACLFGP